VDEWLGGFMGVVGGWDRRRMHKASQSMDEIISIYLFSITKKRGKSSLL
jgi:hypothetical protein